MFILFFVLFSEQAHAMRCRGKMGDPFLSRPRYYMMSKPAYAALALCRFGFLLPRGRIGQMRLDGFDDRVKCCRIADREFAEHFAIEIDAR